MNNHRNDFPMLRQKVNGKLLIYFDNAATSQKPQAVIDAVSAYYHDYCATTHRSMYDFGEQATAAYENARKKVAAFLNAEPEEIIFTQGTTHGINFVAGSWGANTIQKGDNIVITQLEHHSNMIPWQQLAQKNNAELRYIPVMADGILDLNTLSNIITDRTKLVGAVHVSNALGTHNDVATIIAAARAVGARVLIDAAQSAPHQKIDVKKMDCDFLAFSGHKVLGPTGIGILYIKKELHDQVPPYQFGGGMVYEADYFKASWQKSPQKFEAGTPPIAQAIGLGTAIDYMQKNVPFDELARHEALLCAQLIEGLAEHTKIRIYGPVEQLKKSGHLVSFTVDGMHAHDVAVHLSNYGIAVRAGNHCAQPLAKKMRVSSWVRASFHVYNTQEEVEKFLEAITLLRVN